MTSDLREMMNAERRGVNEPGRVLRTSTERIKGCVTCGAPASWVDSVRGPDYWTLSCGHRAGMAILEHVETTFLPATTCACPAGSYNPGGVHEPYCPLTEAPPKEWGIL